MKCKVTKPQRFLSKRRGESFRQRLQPMLIARHGNRVADVEKRERGDRGRGRDTKKPARGVRGSALYI